MDSIKENEIILDICNKLDEPLITYKNDNLISPDIENQIEECIICLDDIKINKSIKLRCCNNKIHKKCIYEWLDYDKNYKRCPNCNQNVYTNMPKCQKLFFKKEKKIKRDIKCCLCSTFLSGFCITFILAISGYINFN